MACLRIVAAVTAIAIHLCLTSVEVANGKAASTIQKGRENDSCDGGNDCDTGLCCMRPNDDAGTVCRNLSTLNEPCSSVTLKEDRHVVSCREDAEAAESTTQAYKPPYDKACPCAVGLVCRDSKVEKKQNGDGKEPMKQEKQEVQHLTCQKPEGSKKKKKKP